MCYGMGCKYEYNFGPHEMTGECSIYHLLGTDKMPEDAECKKEEENERIREITESKSGTTK